MGKSPSDPALEIKELLNLLLSEQEYEREQHRLLLAETPLNVRCKQGISLYPLTIKHQDVGLGGRPILELASQQNLGAFQPGQTAVLFSQAVNEQISGVIQRVGEDWLRLYLSVEESPDWLEEGKLGLDLYYDETTWRAMFEALQKVEKAEKPRLRALRDILLGASPAHLLADLSVAPRPGLNESQQQALARVLQAEDLALIHGPPGTGKTTTLVACIEAVLEHEKQVMVCAPSNTAVDLLTRALAQASKKVLRLGHPARMQQDVWPYTLEEQAANHPNAPVLLRMRKDLLKLRKQASRFHRHFGPAERAERGQLRQQARDLAKELRKMEEQIVQSLIDQAEVICCTLVGAGMKRLKGRHFGTVFIDEAAQALEGACWIPILRAQRVIMAGDHCQLPPTIKNPAAHELAHTLFEKCMERQPQAGTLLNTQYRMHEAIMEFPSLQFYEGRLQAHESVARHLLNPELETDHPVNLPLEWIDTAGCGFDELLDPETRSYANPEEAGLLKNYFEQLAADPGFPQGVSIGMIAPYRQQVDTLKKLFGEQPGLDIETVDSFQGQERDIICLSFVRSNNDGEVGFLQDLRRTNVAMTRARKKLILIGDSATLSSHPFYKELLEYVESYGHWRSAWELMA